MANQAIQISKDLQAIGQSVDDQLAAAGGGRVGFTLFVWSLPVPLYINTLAMKADTISRLRKFINQWEAGRPDIPLHDAAVAQAMMEAAPDTPVAPSAADARLDDLLKKTVNDALDVIANMLEIRMRAGAKMTGADVIEIVRGMKR